jgi:hypothetical protein
MAYGMRQEIDRNCKSHKKMETLQNNGKYKDIAAAFKKDT